MIGPCLCGDPYCSSCGDPAAAELADCVDDLCEQISDFVYSPAEIAIFLNAGMCAVMNARDYAKSQTSEAMQGVDDYIEDYR